MSERVPDPVILSSPRRRLTREGGYWLFAAGTLLTTGLFKGINLITLLGCLMLVLWVLNWRACGRRLRRLSGRRWLEEPVFAATPFTLEADLQNSGRGGQVGLVLRDEGLEQGPSWFVPLLPGRTTGHYRQTITCRQRGRCTLGPLVVSTRLPFGLLERSLVLAPRHELIVLPRLGRLHRGRLRCHLAQVNLIIGRARLRPRRHPAAQADLHGVRAFRSGDTPRWIHWRTTARKGELMVREFEELPTDNLLLVLELAPDGDPLLGEEAISLAATVCWEWCRQTGDRLVLAVAGAEPVVVAGVTGRDLARRTLRCLALLPGRSRIEDGRSRMEDRSRRKDAGPPPSILHPRSSILEPPSSDTAEGLLKRLAEVELPPAPVLVVSTRPTPLPDILGERLRRPVACIDVSDPQGNPFYERTDGHAR
jgi:uncharacterized protein (DUF58 family)